MQDHQITHLEILRLNWLESSSIYIQSKRVVLIYFSILDPSLPVIIELLDHRHSEHEDQRRDISNHETYSEFWDDLGKRNQQEKQVEEVFELVK